MQQKEIPIIYKQKIPGKAKIANYLIGDPTYPLTLFCMKGDESCKSNIQTVFNSMLTEAQNPIECACGCLKARSGILNEKIDVKLESIPTIILTCFALYYFCERNKTGVDIRIFSNANKCFREIFKIRKKIYLRKYILEIPQRESMSGIC